MKCYYEAATKGSKTGYLNVAIGILLGIGFEQDQKNGMEWLKSIGIIEEGEVWMMRELSNREFFSKDRRIDMSGLLFSFGVNLI